MSKNNIVSEALEAFVLNNNAAFMFKEYLESVNGDTVYEDGSCKLYNVVDRYINNEMCLRTVRKGTEFFRARILEDDQISKEYGIEVRSNTVTGFDEKNSREAPLGIGAAGRNNILTKTSHTPNGLRTLKSIW